MSLENLIVNKNITSFKVNQNLKKILSTTSSSLISYDLFIIDQYRDTNIIEHIYHTSDITNFCYMASSHAKLPHHLAYTSRQCLYLQSVTNHNSNTLPIRHPLEITHLLTDYCFSERNELTMTGCLDNTIRIYRHSDNQYHPKYSKISESLDEPICHLNYHLYPITQIYWHNSLMMSGDYAGQLVLWDINRQIPVYHRRIHNNPISFIGCFVDFNHHNLYFTYSQIQHKMVFQDLRINKQIKSINGLFGDLVKVRQSKAGQIIIGYTDRLQLIDIYKNFSVEGAFMKLQKKTENIIQEVKCQKTQDMFKTKQLNNSVLKSINYSEKINRIKQNKVNLIKQNKQKSDRKMIKMQQKSKKVQQQQKFNKSQNYQKISLKLTDIQINNNECLASDSFGNIYFMNLDTLQSFSAFGASDSSIVKIQYYNKQPIILNQQGNLMIFKK